MDSELRNRLVVAITGQLEDIRNQEFAGRDKDFDLSKDYVPESLYKACKGVSNFNHLPVAYTGRRIITALRILDDDSLSLFVKRFWTEYGRSGR